MTNWPKPAEGSWTEHYPELGTGPISFRDSTSPEFYELEREAVFKRAWLNVARIEELPKVGSYLTKEIEAARASVILVKGADQQVRAFYNLCRHRGNKLVWNDFPDVEIRGEASEFTCKHCGWRYGLDGALTFVPPDSKFFGFAMADYGLSPVHCDIWNGFIFINFDPEPRQGLREFLGPMITGLDDYPFDKLTERYEWVAHNNSNWKIFADAFQEYYHVPSLHVQQVPPEVRVPNAGFVCAHFQLDGPHRVVSTAGTRRWLLPAEYMYPIERATQSGLVGPGAHPISARFPPASTPAESSHGVSVTFRSSRTSRSSSTAGGICSTATGPPRTTPTDSRPTPSITRRARCASASNTKSRLSCSRNSPYRTPACSEARRPPWKPASSTTSRSTTRRSWCATCTRRAVDWVEAYQREHAPAQV